MKITFFRRILFQQEYIKSSENWKSYLYLKQSQKQTFCQKVNRCSKSKSQSKKVFLENPKKENSIVFTKVYQPL